MEHRWDFFPVATFYWLMHFAILTKLQCCCMTMAWYWWCSTNQNRFSELVILILWYLSSPPVSRRRFIPFIVCVPHNRTTTTFNGKACQNVFTNQLREYCQCAPRLSFATRWEAESMTRSIMFVNVYNQKEARQRLLLQIRAARFRNLQIQ